MIRSKLCFAAEGVMTDLDTKQVSAFGLLENVQAPIFPVLLPRIALFSMWERLISDAPAWGAELTVSLNGQEITRQVIDINFNQFLRTRATIRLEGLTLAEPGNLVLRLTIPGHDTAEWSIAASLGTPAAPGMGVVEGAVSVPVYQSQPISMSFGKAEKLA